jgi:hypothetical protein
MSPTTETRRNVLASHSRELINARNEEHRCWAALEAAICTEAKRGMPVEDISAETGVSVSEIRRILAKPTSLDKIVAAG